MTKLHATVLACALATLSACSDDPTTPPPPDNSPKIQPLTSKNAVLNNIEVGWNQRSPDAIDDLLDENFVFYLDAGDVGNGVPPSWDRATELGTTTELLQSNTVPPSTGPVCHRLAIDLDLEGLNWVEVPVIASTSTPAEIWYSTVVSYDCNFAMEGDNNFIGVPGSKAQLTVREVEGGWRLVEWRELAGPAATASSDESLTLEAASTGTGSKTWGAIKALYLPSS